MVTRIDPDAVEVASKIREMFARPTCNVKKVFAGRVVISTDNRLQLTDFLTIVFPMIDLVIVLGELFVKSGMLRHTHETGAKAELSLHGATELPRMPMAISLGPACQQSFLP